MRGEIALHDHVGGEEDGDAGKSMIIRVRILTNLEYDLIRDFFISLLRLFLFILRFVNS